MKVYTQQFACETPVQNRFYCPPNSMFKVGVKVLKGGEELSGVTLSSGGQALSADEDKYFGWTTWTLQSLGPGSTEYVVGASGTAQKFKLQQVASDGTVFDMDVQGNVPADVATQGYVQEYVEGQVSDFVTESDVTAIVDSSTSDFVDAQQVADQIALNEDGFVQGKADGQALEAPRAAVALDDTSMSYIIDQGMLDPATIYFPGPVDDDTGGVKPFVAASRSWVDDQGYVTESDVQGMGYTTNDDVTAIVNPVETKVDNLSGEVMMLTGTIYDSADAINYISSEVSADVDSTNVKHISACYLTDYVELSTSGTPDPDTLYFCVG